MGDVKMLKKFRIKVKTNNFFKHKLCKPKGGIKMKTKNFLNGIIIVIFIAAASIFLPKLSFAQTWVQQNSNTNNLLHSVYFLDSQKGFAVGDAGTIRYTINGGQQWLSINGVTAEDLHDVSFQIAALGLIVGDNGRIFRSTNGGTIWAQAASGTNSNLRTVSFGDGGIVYVGGRNGVILRSTNSGVSWSTVASGSARYRGSSAKTPNNSWIVGEGGLISFSSNSGVSFTNQNSNTGSDLHTIFMLDALTGYIGGQNSTVLYTSNGGLLWSSRNSGINQGIDGIHFSNANTGWAVGNNGAVQVTNNAGITWTVENSSTTFELNDVHFPDINHGWAVGMNGTIIFRGGTVGIMKLSGTTPDNFSLNQNYPNPFNPVTTIEFSVSKQSFIELRVFNMLGEEVAALVNQELAPGVYRTSLNAAGLPSGVYFYRLNAPDFSKTNKMLLVK